MGMQGTVGWGGRGTTYEIGAFYKVGMLLSVPLFPVVGCWAFAQAIRGGGGFGIVVTTAWLAGATYQSWHLLCRMPISVVVTDATIRFVSIVGARDVPWAALESVRWPAWDIGRTTWLWRWQGGKVRSWAYVPNGDRLLGEVYRHAPHARVAVRPRTFFWGPWSR